MVDNDTLLVHLHGAVVHLAHADAPHVVVVIDGAYQHLGRGLRVSLGSRDVVDDGLKQRAHILLRIVQLLLRKSRLGGGEYEGAVQLLLGRVQVDEEL